jgi:glutaredoxin
VPQIFLDDRLVGGFTELKKLFEQENAVGYGDGVL